MNQLLLIKVPYGSSTRLKQKKIGWLYYTMESRAYFKI